MLMHGKIQPSDEPTYTKGDTNMTKKEIAEGAKKAVEQNNDLQICNSVEWLLEYNLIDWKTRTEIYNAISRARAIQAEPIWWVPDGDRPKPLRGSWETKSIIKEGANNETQMVQRSDLGRTQAGI